MKWVKVVGALVVAVGFAVALTGCGPGAAGYMVGWADSVSADGTTELVGAPGVAGGKGAVYVYHVSDAGSWTSSSTPVATLTSKAGKIGDALGYSVALSPDGTTAFVGAPGRGGGAGAVYVFHVSSEGTWTSSSTPVATLTGSTPAALGRTVAASFDGTTVLAGAPDFKENAGGAYVFHVSSEDAWVSSSTPAAILSNAAEPAADGGVGGDAVAISADGTTALLSDSQVGGATGGAYVFHVASEAAWVSSSVPTAILSDAGGVPHDNLGDALAFSGDGTTAFLGALGVKRGTGAVDVFRTASESAWASSYTPAAILTNGGGSKGDTFGWWVAVSTDGTTAVVTAPGVQHRTGAAYVFHVADEGAWATSAAPTATLTDAAGLGKDTLGLGLGSSADATTVLLGSPGVEWNTGAADVFHVRDPSSWLSSSTPAARLTNASLPHLYCVVPQLVGRTVRAAKHSLKHAQCRLGKVTAVRSKRNKGRIVSQSAAPKTHLAPRSRIRVSVGE